MSLTLDILVLPTYNTLTMAIADASTYPASPPVSAPSIEIVVPAFGSVSLPFVPDQVNLFNSTSLGLTQVGDPLLPLPDGVYSLKYTVAPAYLNFVNKTIIRVDKLQEKFDGAFMRLDMMECDRAIKTQQKVDLNSIYFFIQGAIAAANNCAVDEANRLYVQADRMLDHFLGSNCYCSGNNYVINFN
tara:strand:- start:1835 stop:2395 length:561 start_codon:yes stop_codon:yes gene_type:complete